MGKWVQPSSNSLGSTPVGELRLESGAICRSPANGARGEDRQQLSLGGLQVKLSDASSGLSRRLHRRGLYL